MLWVGLVGWFVFCHSLLLHQVLSVCPQRAPWADLFICRIGAIGSWGCMCDSVLLIFAGGPGLCRRTEGDLTELCSSGYEENAWENLGTDSSWSRKVFQVRLFSLQLFLRCLWPCRMPQMFTVTPPSENWSITSVPTQKHSTILM